MSQAGLRFGAHTRTHPHLTGLAAQEAEAEMLDSKRAIEDVIQRPATAHGDRFGLERLDVYYIRNPAVLRPLLSWKLRAYIRVRRFVRSSRRALRLRRSRRWPAQVP